MPCLQPGVGGTGNDYNVIFFIFSQSSIQKPMGTIQYKKTMKRIPVYFLISIICYSCIATSTTNVSFSESDNYIKVYEDLPYSKNELSIIANKWMVGVFGSAKSVIQFSDKEEGIIIGKYNLHYAPEMYSNGVILRSGIEAYALIEISVKDNKTRIQIKPIGSWTVQEEKYQPNAGVKKYVATEGGKVLKEVEPPKNEAQDYSYTKVMALEDIKGLGESYHQSLLKKKDDF